MGRDFQILATEKGSIKIRHGEFKNVLNVPSSATKQVVQDEEEAKYSTESIQIEESLLGVTPSPTALEVYEISDISYYDMHYAEEYIQISVLE